MAATFRLSTRTKRGFTPDNEPTAKRAKLQIDSARSRDGDTRSFATNHEDPNKTLLETLNNSGRGKRQRKHVNYDMNMYYRNALHPPRSGSFGASPSSDAESQAPSQSSNSPLLDHDSESDEEIDELVEDDESESSEHEWPDEESERSASISPVASTTGRPSVQRAEVRGAEHGPREQRASGEQEAPEDAPPSYSEAVREARSTEQRQHVQLPTIMQSTDDHHQTSNRLRRRLDNFEEEELAATREAMRSLQARNTELEEVNTKITEENQKIKADLEKYQRIAIAAKKATKSDAGANWREFGRRMNELSEAVKDAEEDGIL